MTEFSFLGELTL